MRIHHICLDSFSYDLLLDLICNLIGLLADTGIYLSLHVLFARSYFCCHY
jgi:hypothetical protein